MRGRTYGLINLVLLVVGPAEGITGEHLEPFGKGEDLRLVILVVSL
jgi:hypothetical protein